MKEKKRNIYLVGGGGNCHSVIDVIEQEGKFIIKGIFDEKIPENEDVLGYKILGKDEKISQYAHKDSWFLITVGQIKTSTIRKEIALILENNNCNIATVISPRAYISPRAKIGKGTVILHDVMVNTGVEIGNHCIINSKANIEHDSKIKNFCHISTGAIVNGNCIIEEGCFLGSNSTISHSKDLGKNSIIGAGSFIK